MKVGIIGAGAAGTSAAKTLQASEVDIDIELFTRSGEQPHNRTLVNKGVAIGLLEPA
ncbi:MAG: pyridine nucleotide-disulfide oxidoreductase, partial [Kocuria rhizophila]